MKLTSIKKKIRGMKRKIKNIELWKEQNFKLDINNLKEHHFEYVKLWIDPFYRLYNINEDKIGHRNPSIRICRKILGEMITIYENWDRDLEFLSKPYYLKLWIGDPDFIESQIVTAIDERIDYYENIFIKNNDNKEFPYEKYNDSRLKNFKWELCHNGYWVDEIDLEDNELDKIREKALVSDSFTFEGKLIKMHFIKTGDMWVGSKN